MNRRNFIQKASIGTAGMVTAFHTPSFKMNRKLKLGVIGSGWYGMVVAKAALKAGDVEISAICDVDTAHLKNSSDELVTLQGKKPAEYTNYHELLEINDLDGVIIGTPPHWHALQLIAACNKGLNIYCEKPLSYDIEEGKAMVSAVEQAGNIVQVGFQRRQSKAFQKVHELIHDGTTGRIHQIGAQIHYNPGIQDTTVQEPPVTLNWDKWCGPAPLLPYRPSIGHKAWRLEKEYGNGHLVDWGIHHIDIIRKIMDFDIPGNISAFGKNLTLQGKITTPDTLVATFHFDDIPLVWQHRLWGPGDLNTQFNNGVFFYGEKATIYASDNKVVLMPSGRNQSQQEIDLPTPDMQELHVANFINAVRANDRNLVTCTVEDAFRSTTSVHLAMASYYTNTDVAWDKRNNTIPENDKAAGLMARPYRQGYKRPVV